MTEFKIQQSNPEDLPREGAVAIGRQLAAVIAGAMIQNNTFLPFRKTYMTIQENYHCDDGSEEFTLWNDFLEAMLESFNLLMDDGEKGFLARAEASAGMTAAAADIRNRAAALSLKQPLDTNALREMMADAGMYSVAGEALFSPVGTAMKATVDQVEKIRYVKNAFQQAQAQGQVEEECDNPDCAIHHQKH